MSFSSQRLIYNGLITTLRKYALNTDETSFATPNRSHPTVPSSLIPLFNLEEHVIFYVTTLWADSTIVFLILLVDGLSQQSTAPIIPKYQSSHVIKSSNPLIILVPNRLIHNNGRSFERKAPYPLNHGNNSLRILMKLSAAYGNEIIISY